MLQIMLTLCLVEQVFRLQQHTIQQKATLALLQEIYSLPSPQLVVQIIPILKLLLIYLVLGLQELLLHRQ